MNAGQTWILASNNAGKLSELQQLLCPSFPTLNIVAQAERGISDADETGLSFVENALLKARHAARLGQCPALADDSGLCVPLLGGAPGIYSARFGGEHGNDARNNQALLDALAPYRSAHPQIEAMFVCVLVWVRHADDPLPVIAQGVWQGEILSEPRGAHGFGYDPLFWLPELACSSAELPASQKNQLSHRAQALDSLLKQRHLLVI